MKKTLATFGTIAVLGVSGVVFGDDQINQLQDKGLYFEHSRGEAIVEIVKDESKIVFSKWDNEVRMGVSYNKDSEGKEEIHAYPIDDNNFEFEIVLNEKPNKDTFDFFLDGVNGLDFYKQTAEEGVPENVINSYAVYYSKTGNEYGTGKAFHIYRPKAIDANGMEVWGDLNYKNGKLSITIPKDFLDKATYPVRVDPNFGKETDGASSTAATADNKLTSRGTPGTSGTVDSMTCRLWLSSAGTGNWRGVIYSSTSDSPDDLLAVTDDGSFTSTSETAQIL